MQKTATIAFLCLVFSAAHAGENEKAWISFNEFVNSSIGKTANQETLLRTLRNPDPEEVEFGIRYSIDRLKQLSAKAVYEAIWDDDAKAFPSLDLEYLRQPVILLAVAAALSSTEKCKDIEKYNFVVSHLNTGDPEVLPFSIIALGYVGSINDIDRLAELAKTTGSKYLFQISISMMQIDYNTADKALRELRNDFFGQGTRQAQLINEVLADHKPVNSRQADGCAAGSL